MKESLAKLLKAAVYEQVYTNSDGKPVVSVPKRIVDINEAGILADYLIANGVIISPCKEGDTVYKIEKFCDENTGYHESYKPSKEFDKPCPHYRAAEWEIEEKCAACDDFDDACYCSLNLNVFCEMCKERIAIQKDKFDFAMMRRVFNTPMFDKNTVLEDMLFLTEDEAGKAIAERDLR